ncbi:MAG: DegV family protein [Lachnospiraceae bacterium]|nr:DegV family protein [Lachnospiraceae bacterium]
MKRRIVVDSGCDLTILEKGQTEEKNNKILINEDEISFARVPIRISLGDREYEDSIDLDVKGFVKDMEAYKGISTSSCPGPQDWLHAFSGADEIFVITITGELSGSYNSAALSKNIYLERHSEKKIKIWDSQSTGPQISLMVYYLKELLEQGLDFITVCERADQYLARTRLSFFLFSIDNFVKNGRISKIAGLATGLLDLHILGRAQEGRLHPVRKCRGGACLAKRLYEEMKEQGYQGGKVILTHCFNERQALEVEQCILAEFPNAIIERMGMSGLCSYYSEKGGVLAGYEIG